MLRIGVDPEYRGLGNGKLLMKAFVQECEEGDCPEAFLEVRASNDSAIHLYEKFGFEVVDRSIAPRISNCQVCKQFHNGCESEIMRITF